MFEILTGKLNMDLDSEAAMCFCAVICQSQNDFMVICNVAKILELVVPLMEHPSATFLTTIEEDLMKLIIKYGMTVGLVCSSLLSEVALKTTNSVGDSCSDTSFCAPQVVQHCVSCLGAIVNKVTHNYKFVWACFNRYYGKDFFFF